MKTEMYWEILSLFPMRQEVRFSFQTTMVEQMGADTPLPKREGESPGPKLQQIKFHGDRGLGLQAPCFNLYSMALASALQLQPVPQAH